MEKISVRIDGAPPVWTPREDVGEQVGRLIVELASLPKGGQFHCSWDREDRAVHAWYVYELVPGCRGVWMDSVYTHVKHIPTKTVEVENQDRFTGLSECYGPFERGVDCAWLPPRHTELGGGKEE